MSTMTASAPIIHWPRAALATVALLVVALVATVSLAVSASGRTTTRIVFRNTPAADQVVSCFPHHPC